MIFSLDDISYEYNDRYIFKNLGFSSWQGNIIRVVGSNGSGKTTLLKIIAGILNPTSGQIIINGIKNAEPTIGYVGHKLGLNLELSVIDNIIFWASLHSCEELIRPAISYFKLGNIADEKCSILSQGQLKRVALARMMAVYSNVWVLDEPEINLDPEFQERLFHAIRVRVMEGGLVIIASHLTLPLENIVTLHMDYFGDDYFD